MKFGFTQRLMLSLASFLAIGLAGLSILVILHTNREPNPEILESNEFVPLRIVEWRFTVARELSNVTIKKPVVQDKVGQSSDGLKPRPTLPTCPPRGREILQARLKISDADFWEIFMRARSTVGPEFSCVKFIEALEWVSKNPSVLIGNNDHSRKALIASASTERVSWNSLPPCLYARTRSGSLALIAGPRAHCNPSSSAVDLSAQTQMLGHWVYNRSVITESVNGRLSAPRQLELSIDPLMQSAVDSISNCLTGKWNVKECSEPENRLRKQVESFSLAIVDQSTGAIAAMICQGSFCDQAGTQGAGALAPLLAQSPPASTAKLFASLALASQFSPRDVGLIPLQLKTSGQIDDSSQKRNEWWERSMICDRSESSPKGRSKPEVEHSNFKTRNCRIASTAEKYANLLGFNEGCSEKSNSLSCGRIQIGTVRTPVPAFLGRFSPSNEGTFPTYLNWIDYDRIRMGKASVPRPPLDQAYLQTSRSVQSVLGAGDTRISALGLAHLSGQVVRAALGQSGGKPWLIRERPPAASDPPMQPAADIFKTIDKSALVTVVSGMRKVMLPAEPKWEGNGTAFSSVSSVFGNDTCRLGCGLWGKTGTVGRADKVYGRTTVFSGAFDWQPLRAALKSSGSHSTNFEREGIWSIGVIATPSNSGNVADGHSASLLAMVVIDRLIRAER